MKNIAVLSGDKRQSYISQFLNNHGYKNHIKNNLDFNDEKILICGTPFLKGSNINCDFYSSFPAKTFISLLKPGQIIFGGNIPEWIIEEGIENDIIFVDTLKDNNVVWNNAALTAEGLIANIITNTDFSISNSSVLVIGFGKCGTNIACRLKALNSNVTIYDHTPWHLSQAKSLGYDILEYSDFYSKLNHFDIIINTVPKEVLTDYHMSLLRPSCVLFEISSKPYGICEEYVKKYSLTLVTCPGIPGATSPKTAGELIAQSIISYLERTEINGS